MKKRLLFFLAILIFFGLLSLQRGQDMNWDQRNYHYFGAYRILSGKVDHHLHASQIQTYINPALYVPFHLMVDGLPPRLAGFGLGLIHGFNFILIYMLADAVLSGMGSLRAKSLAMVAAVGGAAAPMFISELGTSFGDILISLPMLGGLILALRAGRSGERTGGARLFAAGLLFGAAVGLKLTNAVFLPGLALAFITSRGSRKKVGRDLVLAALGGLTGLLVFHGPWSAYLWHRYRNPVFPFFNEFFRSPFLRGIPWRDTRFVPSSVIDGLLYPVQWAGGRHPSAETYFRDVRFLIIFVLLLLLAGKKLPGIVSGKKGKFAGRGVRRGKAMVLFFFSSYFLWLFYYGIQRYIILLELLSALVIFLLLDRLIDREGLKAGLFLALVLTIAVWMRPADWGHLKWAGSWHGTSIPAELEEPDILYIMLGKKPTSYVIPWFPPDSRFVRINGNVAIHRESRLGERIEKIIGGHDGAIRTLAWGSLGRRDRVLLAEYGLAADEGDALEIETRREKLMSLGIRKDRPWVFFSQIGGRKKTNMIYFPPGEGGPLAQLAEQRTLNP